MSNRPIEPTNIPCARLEDVEPHLGPVKEVFRLRGDWRSISWRIPALAPLVWLYLCFLAAVNTEPRPRLESAKLLLGLFGCGLAGLVAFILYVAIRLLRVRVRVVWAEQGLAAIRGRSAVLLPWRELGVLWQVLPGSFENSRLLALPAWLLEHPGGASIPISGLMARDPAFRSVFLRHLRANLDRLNESFVAAGQVPLELPAAEYLLAGPWLESHAAQRIGPVWFVSLQRVNLSEAFLFGQRGLAYWTPGRQEVVTWNQFGDTWREEYGPVANQSRGEGRRILLALRSDTGQTLELTQLHDQGETLAAFLRGRLRRVLLKNRARPPRASRGGAGFFERKTSPLVPARTLTAPMEAPSIRLRDGSNQGPPASAGDRERIGATRYACHPTAEERFGLVAGFLLAQMLVLCLVSWPVFLVPRGWQGIVGLGIFLLWLPFAYRLGRAAWTRWMTCCVVGRDGIAWERPGYLRVLTWAELASDWDIDVRNAETSWEKGKFDRTLYLRHADGTEFKIDRSFSRAEDLILCLLREVDAVQTQE